MFNEYICRNCTESYFNKPVEDVNFTDYSEYVKKNSWLKDEKCPKCESRNIIKVYSCSAAYVKGYGYTDKMGAKNDMDHYLLASGQDPYENSREDPTEVDRIKKRLDKNRKHNPNSKDIHMS